jgi:nitrogen fixation/metabolism regulation signal transduction histidine kinase
VAVKFAVEVTENAAIVRFGDLEEHVVIEGSETVREALTRACANMLITLREATRDAKANQAVFESRVVELLRSS